MWHTFHHEFSVHIVPDEDAIEHSFHPGDAGSCLCDPFVEYRDPDTGVEFSVPLITHRRVSVMLGLAEREPGER